MMKSKATTYLLIAGVVVIWGIILWKIFSPKEDKSPVEPVQREAAIVERTADTLILNYRDPFLGVIAEKPVLKPKTTSRISMLQAEEQPTMEHRLRYLGQITRSGAQYGLIEINGALQTIKKGETANGYHLEAMWQDSVRVKWRNETLIVRMGE